MSPPFPRSRGSAIAPWILATGLLVTGAPVPVAPYAAAHLAPTGATSSTVGNFSAAIGRLVTLVGAAGGGLLALVWARVALSWFSNDVAKKVQAKDRARDAFVGTLIFVAAISGLFWALAQWVVSGT